ncbi:putative basic amino acid antiporter YfcC [Flavobacterium sp. LC2016-23]|uniref:YfcC family protein n=1 Tax=Flavobacterium sp. LC2016-23 TaxID=2666330 RepID=UPI0012B159E8|nr:TIGR00366 family protein [Flavobacterium sp. LC2016-23]MRX38634.1 putative basic amino acid antiporter YfcC [Flavobacterium sp. LC2016-23]
MKLLQKFPDTITIILVITILFIGLTWVIPAGEFDRLQGNNTEKIIAGSYKHVEASPQGIKAFLEAPIKGFISASQIIAFVFLVGGAFSIINLTGAINAGLFNVIVFSQKKPKHKIFIIPFLIILFSFAGATFGMSEEILIFILITVPMAKAMGYDAIVGAAIPIVGTGVGFGGAFSNPFTIGIAQGIAQIPIFSGMEYRIFVWFVLTTCACVVITHYAIKIQKNPEKSLLFGSIDEKEKSNVEVSDFKLNGARKIILYALFASIIILIYGVSNYDWYINEIAALFLALAIFVSIIYRMSMSKAIDAFVCGAKDMMTAALVIGLAKGLLIITQEGKIIDTILNSIVSITQDTPKAISAECIFFFQSFLNFFIPSGSGQASLTMPIIIPICDASEISRQMAVLTFQLGDGFTNLIIPTSGVTMGALSLAKIPYSKWFKWMLPRMLVFLIASMLLILPPLYLFNW